MKRSFYLWTKSARGIISPTCEEEIGKEAELFSNRLERASFSTVKIRVCLPRQTPAGRVILFIFISSSEEYHAEEWIWVNPNSNEDKAPHQVKLYRLSLSTSFSFFHLSVCLYVFVFACLCVSLSVHLLVCQSVSIANNILKSVVLVFCCRVRLELQMRFWRGYQAPLP